MDEDLDEDRCGSILGTNIGTRTRCFEKLLGGNVYGFNEEAFLKHKDDPEAQQPSFRAAELVSRRKEGKKMSKLDSKDYVSDES